MDFGGGDQIRFERMGMAGLVTLTRPKALNALTHGMVAALSRALTAWAADPGVAVVVLQAAGRAFCAGGDVREMAEKMGSGDEITAFAHIINSGIQALTESSVPVVVAAQGTTAGGGLGILMAGDYAVIGEDSQIGSLYANIGLTPDLSVTAQLARAVGERRALQLVLQDRMLSAAEALEWGLVAEVTAPDAVGLRAEEVARYWLAGASGAYGQAKRLIRSSRDRSFADQLREEARSIGAAFDTPEAQVRIHAFTKRDARR